MTNRFSSLAIGIYVLSIVMMLVTGAYTYYQEYQIKKQILSWQSRAQVAADAKDMLEYLNNLQRGMEKWQMTQGHAAYIYKTPENDMGYIYRSVTQHVARAELLVKMDPSSPEYQTGLDDLRGSLRELQIHATKFWGIHQGFVVNHLFLICLLIVFLPLLAIFLFAGT